MSGNAVNSPFNSPVWQGLMQQALVGTQRMDALDDAPWPVELQALVRDANATVAVAGDAHAGSIKLLRAAAAAGLWQRAGFVPQTNDQPLALSSAPEDLNAAPEDLNAAPAEEAVIRALNAALRDGPESLIRQSWHVLAQAGLRLPQSLLPAALEAGARNSALRADLLSVLGARGLWLAQQNPAWKFAAGTDQQADPEKLWSEGTFEQRLAVLRNERANHPQAARERLEAAVKELNAKERLAMLEVLRARLSMDDEALLERLLTDRSGDVKQLAAELLSALPQSAHSQRVIAWITPLLKRDGDTWTIEPPEKENTDWPRDGIHIKVQGFFQGGERAWWLFQLTRLTPPAWWTETLGKSPEEVFAWAAKSEWKRQLWDGLLEAAARTPGREWLPVLITMQSNRFAQESLQTLLSAMTLAERDVYWQERLKAAPTAVCELLMRMGDLMQPDEQLSPTLSQSLLATLEPTCAAAIGSTDWTRRHNLSQALLSAALWLALEKLPDLLVIVDKASATETALQGYEDVWQQVRSIVGIRQTLQKMSA